MMSFKEWWKHNAYKYPQADYERDGHEAVAKAAWDAQQAMIDQLMLEYCPDEMTEEQKTRWAKHQAVAPVSAIPPEAERYARITIENASPKSANLKVCGEGLILKSGESVDYCLGPTSKESP